MSKLKSGKLNPTDIQGFVLRGYNLPLARHLFLQLNEPEAARTFIDQLLGLITTGQHWDQGKPVSTVNIGFTHKGLTALELPLATLISFPVEFQQGMKSRAAILGDTGRNSPENWDELWRNHEVHVWLGVNAQTAEALDAACVHIQDLCAQGGATILGHQNAASLVINGQPTSKEHFGYTDGFGNPDYVGVDRNTQRGQGKLTPDGKDWTPLATGELLLGYADEAGELPVAPIPHILAANGTFMVFRKLHQNVATFRAYLDEMGARYPGGKEKLASKFIGRWRDGTPVERSPDKEDPSTLKDHSTDFTFGDDPSGSKCPIGAHLRRVNPRDAFGFTGRLINRRRITRRGLPYGPYTPADQPVQDDTEHGVVFMALNASLSRQFEFVQQQWIEYGNDSHLGNEKDMLMGNHSGPDGESKGKFVVQGDTTQSNPPFVCANLTNFVELRGGDYFFLPSITALGMLALELVDPR
jgi:Dyp-type peroxidase family